MWFVFQDQGSTLTTSIQTIERSWAQTDIGQLQKSISEATSAFKGVENDVINLRSDAHVVTEAARARSQQIQVSGRSIYQWKIVICIIYIYEFQLLVYQWLYGIYVQEPLTL